MNKTLLKKEDEPKLPKPQWQTGGPVMHLQEVMLGTRCFYCNLYIPHEVKRSTCKRCIMNYCWKCMKHIKNYYCLRCYGTDFTSLYNNDIKLPT